MTRPVRTAAALAALTFAACAGTGVGNGTNPDASAPPDALSPPDASRPGDPDASIPGNPDAGPRPGRITATLGRNPFFIDGQSALALLAEPIPTASPRLAKSRLKGGAEECLGSGATNLVRINENGGLEPAACAVVDEVIPLRDELLVRMGVTFDVTTELLDENGNVVGSETVQRRIGAFVFVDYTSNAVDLIGLTQPESVLPDAAILSEFAGQTTAGKLIFHGARDPATSDRDLVVYEPLGDTYTVLSSPVFGTPRLNYVTGNFLQWSTRAGIYQLFDSERNLRYSRGSDYVNATALDGRIALIDRTDARGDLFDMADGSAGGICEVRGGYYAVELCSTDEPCTGGRTSGAIMQSTGCDGSFGGHEGICHVSPTCEITPLVAEIPSNLIAPDPSDQTRDPAVSPFLISGRDYYVMRTENRLLVAPKAGGATRSLAIPGNINLAYFAVARNTVFYAGETPAAVPVYGSINIDTGEHKVLTALEARDRILPLRR